MRHDKLEQGRKTMGHPGGGDQAANPNAKKPTKKATKKAAKKKKR